MKKIQEESQSTLGSCIKMERKKAGLTQAQLGKLVGLGESRISKIEHGAPITPEVASFILGKMGSELQLKVVSPTVNAPQIMIAIYNFSRFKNIPLDRAFRYLKTFKGLNFLNRYMDIEQTLSEDEINANLSMVCANNGGEL
ncbi:MAG: helix-turn-helix domain-containing protein [Bacteroidales bacterium]|nr:helix-turn-helix domain-containing protein [Bacteroidales bacterium]